MKKNIKNYVGMVNLANNGQKMTIINYVNSHDIDVRFEDNTVVKHKSLSNFLRGRIANPNCKVDYSKLRKGEQVITNLGQVATVIEYRSYDDIDVQFDDNYIAKNVSYKSFKAGTVLNKNIANNPAEVRAIKHANKTREIRKGEVRIARNGQKMTIEEYNSAQDIVVKFEDDTLVKTTYDKFNKGNVSNPNFNARAKERNHRWVDRKGEQNVNTAGELMTIIRYGGVDDIDIQFEDKTIIYNKKYSNFARGRISKNGPKPIEHRMNETSVATNGQLMTIIKVISNERVVVRFEDNFEKEVPYQSFKSGRVKNPNKPTDTSVNHVGEVHKDINGEEATIVDFEIIGKNKYYIVEYADKKRIRTSYHSIKHSKFSKRKADKSGETYIANNGQVMEIIEYKDGHHCTVKFEDNTIVRDKNYKDIKEGLVRNPNFFIIHRPTPDYPFGYTSDGAHVGSISVDSILYKGTEKTNIYYSCTCNKCGEQMVLTPSEMLKHKCNIGG